MPIDLSKATREELLAIHNEVLRHVAEKAHASLVPTHTTGAAGSPHDSHSSNHSNNSIPTDMKDKIADILRAGTK